MIARKTALDSIHNARFGLAPIPDLLQVNAALSLEIRDLLARIAGIEVPDEEPPKDEAKTAAPGTA